MAISKNSDGKWEITYVGSNVEIASQNSFLDANIVFKCRQASNWITQSATGSNMTIGSNGQVRAAISTNLKCNTTGWATSTGTVTEENCLIGTVNVQSGGTHPPQIVSELVVAANTYTLGDVYMDAIQTETKSALANGKVTPTSGKYLTSVDVAVPIPAGCKWYGYRSWTSSNLASNMFLKNENWTNSQGTTGIAIGDIIALETTITDKSNRVVYLLIKVTGMSGTTAIGDSIGVVEKYKEASPTINANTVYRTGTGTPSATLDNNGDIYLDLNS